MPFAALFALALSPPSFATSTLGPPRGVLDIDVETIDLNPAPGLRFRIYVGTRDAPGRLFATGLTDAKGNVFIRDVPAGNYAIEVDGVASREAALVLPPGDEPQIWTLPSWPF